MESSDFMSGASEVGSLTAHSNDESQFVGSSSGVYFIKTVRQAFSKGLVSSTNIPSGQDFPPAEDTIVGSEDSPCEKHHLTGNNPSPFTGEDAEFPCHWDYHPTVIQALGKAPPLEQARELMMMYFKVWHPLFPFLHGPTFLREMEIFYSDTHDTSTKRTQSEHKNACWATIFQCVFNLASLLRADLRLPPDSKIKTPTNIHSLLGTLVYRHDIPSLQALLAAQLYLLATMSLRTASTVGGCTVRSMLHAGLHRCPFRYKELTSHDRHLRKRIFWCAYAIDRYLSQALGLPLGIQDSDVDVCLPGAHEVHDPLSSSNATQGTTPSQPNIAGDLTSLEAAIGKSRENLEVETSNRNMQALPSQCDVDYNGDYWQQEQRRREAALANYVVSGKLTGRALELFHKSIHVRSVRRSSVLFLISDVHKWWNGLPPNLQGTPPRRNREIICSVEEEPFDLGPFFTVLYQHLILLINRPSLSLNTTSPDFCSGLQTCIGAARGILSALQAQIDGGQALFWPGFLSAAWMSGLVIAFACQLKQYVLSKGCQEISECLEILHLMSTQWETAKHCHTALSSLFLNIRRQSSANENDYLTFESLNPAPSSSGTIVSAQTPASSDDCYDFGRQKRQKTNDSHSANNPRRESRTYNTRNTVPPGPRPNISLASNEPAQNTENVQQPYSTVPYETGTVSNNPSSWNLSGLEDTQWPGGSASATNFDLNMTDLFQGTNWDCLFDLTGQLQNEGL